MKVILTGPGWGDNRYKTVKLRQRNYMMDWETDVEGVMVSDKDLRGGPWHVAVDAADVNVASAHAHSTRAGVWVVPLTYVYDSASLDDLRYTVEKLAERIEEE